MKPDVTRKARIRFFKARFAQMIEKLLRLERFVFEAEKQTRSGRQFNIVDTLKGAIEQEKANLLEKVQIFDVSSSGEFTLADQDLHIEFLLTFSGRLNSYHRLLRWIYSPWPEDETDAFLLLVFQQDPVLERLFTELRGSVVFVDEYNFWEYEAGQEITTPPRGKTVAAPVFALPKIEKDNALTWPLLVHEVGHEITERYGISSHVSESVLTGLDSRKRRVLEDPAKRLMLRRWANEFSSDLIAFHMLGPGFLFPLQNMALNEVSTNLQEATEMYPPPAARIQLLANRLGSDLGVSAIHPTRKELRTTSELFSQRLEIDTATRFRTGYVDDQAQGKRFFLVADSFRETIEVVAKKVEEVLREARLLVRNFDEQKYDNSVSLANRLEAGIPICSRSKESGMVRQEFGLKGQPEDWPSKVSARLDDICGELDEQPGDVAEIITAGWIRKTRVQQQWLEKHFLGSDKRITERFEDYKRDLFHLDLLLVKSIQTSLVHSFYADKRLARGGQSGGRPNR